MTWTDEKKAIWGWAAYDWANSAFATSVMAGFFPVFFKNYWCHGADINMSTAQLGIGNSIASLIVALLAPVLGAVSDRGASKKRFLVLFGYLGVSATAVLFFVNQGQWLWAIVFYAVGIIGFSGGNVFYDALMPTVTTADNIDYVSGMGYAMGYLGGGLLFLVNVVMTLKPGWFGLPDAVAAVRWSFLSVAFWWGGFMLLTVHWVHEHRLPRSVMFGTAAIRESLLELIRTVKRIRRLKNAGIFLLAYWCYIDGVDTIIKMAVDYGLSLGFASSDLITALLMVQFVGFPAALGFGKLGQRWNVRKAIYLALGVYVWVTIWATMMTGKAEFFILALFIGCAQGGIQALSRSYYTRLIPEHRSGEYFGIYNMLGKFAAILGPALMGIVGLTVRKILMPPAPTPEQTAHIGQLASRCSIGSILILLICGAVLFHYVDEEKGRQEALAVR